MGYFRSLFSAHGMRLLWLAFVSGLAVVLLSIASNWIYDGIKDQNRQDTTSWVWPIILAALGVLVTWVLAVPAALRSFRGSQAWQLDCSDKATQPHEALILMPSRLFNEHPNLIATAHEIIAGHRNDRQAALVALVDPNNPLGKSRWPWQQTLRLMRTFPNLKTVVAVLSKEVEGDGHYPEFQRLLTTIGPPGLKVFRVRQIVNGLDYDSVQAALDEAAAICKAQGHKPSRTSFDITSGLKSFAAIAAIQTLNSGYVFTYVVMPADVGDQPSDAEKIGRVVLYDAHVWSERDG
jgi:hypothetical protein